MSPSVLKCLQEKIMMQKPLVQIDTLDILLSEIGLVEQNGADCVEVIQYLNFIWFWQETGGGELGHLSITACR